MPTDGEIAAFEAGIKLGALYHQFVGTPISSKTAGLLEDAMQSAISLQPYVSECSVRIDRDQISENIFGYSELKGSMIWAEVEISRSGLTARARLEYDGAARYPMMHLLEVQAHSSH
ncbi:MAG: Dihydroneopterin aldolase [Methanosaeta sp. PtaB.Bin039]|nr:MAG: Dihydroneopterin aldolase [Methanosaeta sp. PtaB.Bin039]HOT06440.1 dihydroneopterin aldolase family protein [Methanotrichaceae archaeon]HQF16211.1 dihydroneopterin aldolase family protein [Methanotrichaceae archaeon]HQI90947.1 dihydroneopterin aldolase family protein [Methanotrichaceae archaeon]HQJ28369.1 dihydroneopterin aldolase family protein [Methanotrichaceae archaeon]